MIILMSLSVLAIKLSANVWEESQVALAMQAT